MAANAITTNGRETSVGAIIASDFVAVIALLARLSEAITTDG